MKELLTLTSEVLISLPELHGICAGFSFILLFINNEAKSPSCLSSLFFFTILLCIKTEICLFIIERVIACGPDRSIYGWIPRKLRMCLSCFQKLQVKRRNTTLVQMFRFFPHTTDHVRRFITQQILILLPIGQ